MAEAGVAVAPMFKKKGAGKRDVRVRDSAVGEASTSRHLAEDGKDGSDVVLKKRKLGMVGPRNPLLQASGLGLSKKGNEEWEDKEDDDVELKLDRYGEGSVSSVVRSNAEGGGMTVLGNKADATRESDWYDESHSGPMATSVGANNDDGVYRGASSYNTFISTRDDGVSAKLKAATKGPVRGGNNVRTITVVDYQPDVCKDYKETGYCGFGDTCKFMHDRSDYLAGWQMDALPNSNARRGGNGSNDDEEEEEEEIPFACLICRKPFTDPILTKCGHYFCSACAIKRFSKTSKCFACGKQTQGIFNSASKVLERMEKARQTREDEKDKKRWNRGDAVEDLVQQSAEIIEGVEIGGQDDGDD